MARIARIGVRIVVAEFHVHLGSFGKKHRLPIAVVALPIEVPVFDQKKPLLGPIGQAGVAFHFLSQIMSVRIDPEHFNVHRQFVKVVDFVVRNAGLDIDRPHCQGKNKGLIGRRLVSEKQSDAGLHEFLRFNRPHVHFDHEIAARIQVPGHAATRLDARPLSGRPAQEISIGKGGLAAAAPSGARTRLRLIQFA